eukprot:CAMPEP_0176247078 /NCGR_PEP_ID=MMETSP0121_2-20121125/32772_1 /TAXON_ID=160619 /ORGANISM="Kryptoperidinium foliaceum, Strain CCMP 1326" /LENGTH=65 /DNA_ID=CAMNT_0017586727 /DNA_START=240 /DNA_END=437 /DNA_ORIENTATION=+
MNTGIAIPVLQGAREGRKPPPRVFTSPFVERAVTLPAPHGQAARLSRGLRATGRGSEAISNSAMW